MTSHRNVVVYGAYGHTGRFTVAELLRRGWTPVLAGRDPRKLAALGEDFPALERRLASVDDPASLDRALDGTIAVLNCAGSFLDTAPPVVEAALRARIHYLDTAAEQQAVQDTFDRFADAAKLAGISVVPAMAFYGGLADLLATAAMADWTIADEITVAVALDSWRPTIGTRLTGRRNTARRLVVANGALAFLADPPSTREWTFPAPFGTQDVVALPLSEIITISRHLHCAEVHSYMNLAPLRDLRDPDTPPPTAVDASGRSAQVFAVDVVVRRGAQARRAIAQGRDIYAVTAPLIVEAMERICSGRCAEVGVAAAGQAFAAEDFLASLAPEHLSWSMDDACVSSLAQASDRTTVGG